MIKPHITFRPLQADFPIPRSTKRSKFKAKYSQTVEFLYSELNHLDARQIVLEVAVDLYWVKQDGMLRSGARPTHPGVRLSFHSWGKHLSFPCSTYDYWEDNLRAIALSLEALRSVDRYGVTQGNQQYTGFTAIAAPGASESAESLRLFLLAAAGSTAKPYEIADWKSVLRSALIAQHPDRPQGNHEKFIQVQNAGKVLGLS
jgi:hypothetical protein